MKIFELFSKRYILANNFAHRPKFEKKNFSVLNLDTTSSLLSSWTQEMMEAADPNGDGKLDFGEFRTLLGM